MYFVVSFLCLLVLYFSQAQIFDLPQSADNQLYYDALEECRTISQQMRQELKRMQQKSKELEESTVLKRIEALETFKTILKEENIQLRKNISNLERKEIAFTVLIGKKGKHYDIKKDQVIKFELVRYNIGDSYDKKTGKFKCPVAGTYVFFVSVYSQPDKSVSVAITVNGLKNEAYASATAVPNHAVGGASLAVVRLEKNDYVWVRADEDATPGLGLFYSQNSFSGFLLYEE